MAYSFFLQQKSISAGLESQITSMKESIEQEGISQIESRTQEVINRQQQIDIEKNEEGSQLSQIHEAGVNTLLESAIGGALPAIAGVKGAYNTVKDLYQSGTQAVTDITEGVSAAKASAQDLISGLKETGGDVLGTIQSTGETISGDLLTTLKTNISDFLSSGTSLAMKQPTLEDLGVSASSLFKSSFASPTTIFQKAYTSKMTSMEQYVSDQTELLNQARGIVSPEQFGQVADYAGRQLSDIPTPVLPTVKPVITETSFGGGEIGTVADIATKTASDVASTITSTASDIASAATGAVTGAVSDVASAATGAASDIASAATSAVESGLAAAGEFAALDVLGPIGVLGGIGLSIWGLIKGEHEVKARPPPLPSLPQVPSLPSLPSLPSIQSIVQSGI